MQDGRRFLGGTSTPDRTQGNTPPTPTSISLPPYLPRETCASHRIMIAPHYHGIAFLHYHGIIIALHRIIIIALSSRRMICSFTSVTRVRRIDSSCAGLTMGSPYTGIYRGRGYHACSAHIVWTWIGETHGGWDVHRFVVRMRVK